MGKKFNDPCDAINVCGENMVCSATKAVCECSPGNLKVGSTCSNIIFKFYISSQIQIENFFVAKSATYILP